ncbi:MAG TPA: cupredoxin domain-containing protein [Actinomycetota bacterium]
MSQGTQHQAEGSTERQSLLLPILMPVGLLAIICLVLFGFSRVLLAISHAAATVVALVALVTVMAVASFVASRRQVSGASLFWMVSAIAGGIIAVGGLAVVAAPLAEEVEPQVVLLAAGPSASVDGFTADALDVGADAPIELEFDNQEEGIQHNVVIFDGEDADAPQLFSGALITGPDKINYAVAPLPEGGYFFHCEIHPTTMVGEITSVPGGGEDGGGGGEGGSTGPIVAQALQFNTAEIDLPADEASTLTFDNQEPGVPHNIAIYGDESLAEVLFQGATITGPDTVDYDVPAIAEGEYYFHCDTHPDMQGTVVVAPAPGGGAEGDGGQGGGSADGGGDGGG